MCIRDSVYAELVAAGERAALVQADGLARGHGASTIGGLAMLGSQADRAFQRWTGQPIPREVLKAWLETA